MVNELFKDINDRMNKTVEHYQAEVATIRTGRASVNILDSILVDYYGTPTPLNQVSTISIPEPQQIAIAPFTPNDLKAIERAIIASDLGINPSNDGQLIRLNIPSLTAERRKELVKRVNAMIEDGRTAIRNLRREANDTLKKAEKASEVSESNLKRALDDVQEMTDKHIEALNKIAKSKEEEILL